MCTLKPQRGPCNESMTLWYYDPVGQNCHTFTFGGCFGNKNRFLSREECISHCYGVGKKVERPVWITQGSTSQNTTVDPNANVVPVATNSPTQLITETSSTPTTISSTMPEGNSSSSTRSPQTFDDG